MNAGPRSAQDVEAARYQLPRTTGTVWLGLRMSSLVTLALALAGTILLVLAGSPVPAAAALLLLAAVLTLVPVADRPALQWIWPAVGHQLRAGHHAWAAPDLSSGDDSPHGRQRRAPLPPECGRLVATHIAPREDPTGSAPVALLIHRATPRRVRSDAASQGQLPRGARTVVLEVCSGSGFGLLDAVDQDATLTAWGGSLDALAADDRVLRLQWLTHTRPVTMTQPAAEQHQHRHQEPQLDAGRALDLDLALERDRDLVNDYEALVRAVAAQAWDHTQLLAVTLRPDNGRARSGYRGHRGEHESREARDSQSSLLEQIRDVTGLLLFADLLARPLRPDELGSVLRLLTEPDYHGGITARRDEGEAAWGVRCRKTDWTTVRTGDAWHRSYAVSSWPNLPLPGDWLAGLLTSPPPAGTSRTLSVHARPVSPVHAVRQARAAAAKIQLDAADRSRFGLTGAPTGTTPLDDQRATDAAALETELAAGYRMLHSRIVLTISATSPHRLQQATAALRATTATHRIDLRPLHGQHHLGLVASLPLTVIPGSRP